MTLREDSAAPATLAAGIAALAAAAAAMEAAFVRSPGCVHPFAIGFFGAASGASAARPRIARDPSLARPPARPPARPARRAGFRLMAPVASFAALAPFGEGGGPATWAGGAIRGASALLASRASAGRRRP